MSDIDLAHISRLVRLGVPENPQQQKEGFGNILKLVDQIRNLDTGGVEPSRHPTLAHVELRADAITESDQDAGVAAGSPAAVGKFFSVPKVVK